jgi:ATP-dependent Clp protease ATP-binding subunit ClpA
MGAQIHPIFLLFTLVGLGSGLYTLYERAPAVLPFIFGLSVLGLIVRLLQLRQEASVQKTPSAAIRFDELRKKDLLGYAGWLKENVRGHDAVVDLLVKKIQQNLALAGPRRTLGAFMLVGPTGTGKTFLAELVAHALYPDSETVILRMNQYKDPGDVFTLIGPPPGHMGYEVGGALTRPLLENPYRVVILDELEKAHMDVQHCLYDILDSAQCREKSSGRTVHFGACAIFATCNGGVESLRALKEKFPDPMTRIGRTRDALSSAGFEKALLARFDEIQLLDELPPISVAEVACLQLVKYWKQYGIEVTYASPEVLLEAMRKNAEFKEYGVRQLAHFIQTLTDTSIEEARKNGASRVRLDIDRLTGRITIA